MPESPFHLPEFMTAKDFSKAFGFDYSFVANHQVSNGDGFLLTMETAAKCNHILLKKGNGFSRLCLTCKECKPYESMGVRKDKHGNVVVSSICKQCQHKQESEKWSRQKADPKTHEHIKARLRVQGKKEISRIRRLKYYKANQKKCKAIVKAWKEKNKDKVVVQRERRRGNKVNVLEKTDVSKIKAVKCYYCGGWLKGDYHIDHIVPLSKGGVHAYFNLCAACPTCNMSKHTKNVNDFIKTGQLEIELC
jgi:5-methylcytosine-specific restriction endonuclease McrA